MNKLDEQTNPEIQSNLPDPNNQPNSNNQTEDPKLSHKKQLLIFTFGQLPIALVAVLLYWFFLPEQASGELLGFAPIIAPEADILFSCIAAVVLVVGALALMILLMRAAGPDKLMTDEVQEMADEFSTPELVIIFLIGAFVEEFLFRGAITGIWGLLPGALLFTAAHLAYWKRPLLLLDVFVLGLLLGAFWLMTESLLLCTLIHFAYNLTTMALLKSGLAEKLTGAKI